MQRRLLGLAAAVICAALLGCSPLPRLSAPDIVTVQFWAMLPGSNTKWIADSEDVDRFVTAYSEARRVSDDWGTTPPARI
ncbi:MAG: hypothetical protein Q8S43_09625, partial [Actinomycetota bacterium]|nr:hypothetical protein [Actinomycetota bacterium]